MFFIGVFGIQDKQKEVCNLQIECKNCSSNYLKLYKTYRYFHIFFLPVYKWRIRYHAICDICGTIYNIPEEKGKKTENGEKGVITYWDIKEVYKKPIIKICPKCNSQVDDAFEYCPYCGKKL